MNLRNVPRAALNERSEFDRKSLKATAAMSKLCLHTDTHAHTGTRAHIAKHTIYEGCVGQACEARRLTGVLNRASDLQVSPFSTWKRKHREHVTSAVTVAHTLKQLWARPRLPLSLMHI